MEVRPATPEGCARQRRAAVVERRCNGRARSVVDLAREVTVKRLDEIFAGLVGQFRPLQRSFEPRIDRPHPLGHLPGVQSLLLDALHDLLQLGHDRLARLAATQTEQLNLVVAMIFRRAHAGTYVALKDRDQFAQALYELGVVCLDQRQQRIEIGVRQKVYTLGAVIVTQAGVDACAARGQGCVHFAPRPGQRLDTPLLPLLPIIFKGGVVALAHDHVVKRKPDALQPLVGLGDHVGRHVTLRDFDRAVHHVRANDGILQRLAPPRGRHTAKVPELTGKQWDGRNRVVAGGQRHDIAAGSLDQILLAHDQHRTVIFQMLPDIFLKDERVTAPVIGDEDTLVAHRLQNHGLPPQTRLTPHTRNKRTHARPTTAHARFTNGTHSCLL